MVFSSVIHITWTQQQTKGMLIEHRYCHIFIAPVLKWMLIISSSFSEERALEGIERDIQNNMV